MYEDDVAAARAHALLGMQGTAACARSRERGNGYPWMQLYHA